MKKFWCDTFGEEGERKIMVNGVAKGGGLQGTVFSFSRGEIACSGIVRGVCIMLAGYMRCTLN